VVSAATFKNKRKTWRPRDNLTCHPPVPADLKEQIKKEASEKGMDTGSYICGLLTGDIKRKKSKKRI
jgi:hypothetical protein